MQLCRKHPANISAVGRVLFLILPGDCAATLVASRLPELWLAEEQHWELPVRTSRALPALLELRAREAAERPYACSYPAGR
jgi:hypothetical protein